MPVAILYFGGGAEFLLEVDGFFSLGKYLDRPYGNKRWDTHGDNGCERTASLHVHSLYMILRALSWRLAI